MAKHGKVTKQNKVVAGVMAFMVGLVTGTSGVSPVNSPAEFAGQFNEEARVEAGRVTLNDNTFECKDAGWVPGEVLQVKPNYAAVHPEDLVNYSEEEKRCIKEDWITPGYTILIDIENNAHLIDNNWIETVRDDA